MMENQPAYGQEDEIDLVALTFTLLRKYRQILAAALAGAIIFGAAAGAHTAWGAKVPNPHISFSAAHWTAP